PFSAAAIRFDWESVMTHCNYYGARSPCPDVRRRDLPLRFGRVRPDGRRLASGDNSETKVIGVFAQVGDELIAREISGIAARNSEMSKPRKSTYGVQVKSIVATRPGASDARILLENNGLDPSLLEGRRGR